MRVLLTGATGFIGTAVLGALEANGHETCIAGRRRPAGHDGAFRPCNLAALGADEALALVKEVDIVLHLAGHAHAMRGGDDGVHRSLNRDAPIRLAEAAARHNVRFLFLSSIKALGDPIDGVLSEEAQGTPQDAYGAAKFEAETAIRALLPRGHVILRPALVVGEGAKGNLARLLALARLPVPLPFAGVDAPRSLVSRRDLAALITRLATDTAFDGMSLTVADPEPLSLRQMMTALRAGLGRRPGLFPFPQHAMAGLLALAGRQADAERLFTACVARPSLLLAAGWQPALPAHLALRAMAEAFRPG
jgi:UDP-glucose 4-epimerase